MAHGQDRYIPAAGHDLFLPLYDPVLSLMLREEPYRRLLLERLRIQPHDRILDLGCGTGTTAKRIAEQAPQARVVGVDGDPKALAVAARKLAGTGVELTEAFANRLPYPDRSFTRALSSLVFHHLTYEDKLAAVREVARVLEPGGMFLIADFGPPIGWYSSLITRLAIGERLHENLKGAIPQVMAEGGLQQVAECGYHNSLFGTLRLWSGLTTP